MDTILIRRDFLEDEVESWQGSLEGAEERREEDDETRRRRGRAGRARISGWLFSIRMWLLRVEPHSFLLFLVRTWIKLGGKGLSKVESVKKKEGGGKFVPSEEQLEEMDRASKECPVDKDELGSATWKLLHTLSVNYPDRPTVDEKEEMAQFLRLFSRLYPCPPCAEDFRQDLRSHPPQLDSSSSFARWLCGAHNRVNAKLDKPQFDCDRVFERWRDGWQDGRCDEL